MLPEPHYRRAAGLTVREASEQTQIPREKSQGAGYTEGTHVIQYKALEGAELAGGRFAQIETGPILTDRGQRR